MSLEKIYSVVKKKNFEDGIAYIVTGGRHLIEAQLYSGLIVHVKSRTLSYEQILESLLTDGINQVDVSPSAVKLEVVQPQTIGKIFQASSPFVLNPDDALPQRLLNMLRLMGNLVKAGTKGLEAFEIMADEILRKYPKFSLEKAVIKKRIDDFSNEFLIAIPSPDSEPIPSSERDIPAWVFNSVVMPDSLFKDILLYFIFFGEVFQPVFRTIVKKESGFGAKVGYARISQVVYSAAANNNSAFIFKGAAKMGELNLIWYSENKTGVLITQADLDKLHIKDGDTVSLVFKQK